MKTLSKLRAGVSHERKLPLATAGQIYFPEALGQGVQRATNLSASSSLANGQCGVIR
ncbi:MAG: hypothetical protein HYY84_13660 [Deltaproteobacteria bacterium]|nr:hypothetical protein [Deltaproteobacteria bacterium]